MRLSFDAQPCEVFFRSYRSLNVKAPELDDFRKDLVDGKGIESIQPLYLFVGAFNAFKFSVIMDKYALTVIYLIFLDCYFGSFFFPSSFCCLFL